MTENTITSLREMLFETMRGVKDGTIDLDRAKTVSDIGQVIINSAKTEVDALRVIGGTGSGFIPALPPQKPEPKPALQNLRDKGILPERPGITNPAPGVTRHTC